MPQSTRFIHSLLVVMTALTLLLSGLPLYDGQASAASSQPRQSANAKTQKAATQKKTQTVRKSSASSSRTPAKSASSKKAPANKKSTARSSASAKTGAKRTSAAAAKSPYKSAVVFNNSTRQVLYANNPNRKVPPASLTKILSIYVAEDTIRARKLKRNTLVPISAKAAAARGSRMGLSAGERVPLEDLLHGMAVSSGNDASIAIAEFIGGSEKKFVQMMNKKARSLGMNRSTFINASGLPAPGQFTTAKDMLALARAYLAAYPDNLQKHHNHAFNSYKGNMTSNANPLIRGFQGADGLKTGFVSAAGYNLIATAQRNNQRVIGVILGAPSSAVRATEAYSIMEASFDNPTRLTAMSSSADLAAVAGKAPKSTATASSSKSKKPTLQAAGNSKPAPKQKAKKTTAKPVKANSAAAKNKKAASGTPPKKTADKKQKPKKVSVL